MSATFFPASTTTKAIWVRSGDQVGSISIALLLVRFAGSEPSGFMVKMLSFDSLAPVETNRIFSAFPPAAGQLGAAAIPTSSAAAAPALSHEPYDFPLTCCINLSPLLDRASPASNGQSI